MSSGPTAYLGLSVFGGEPTPPFDSSPLRRPRPPSPTEPVPKINKKFFFFLKINKSASMPMPQVQAKLMCTILSLMSAYILGH